MHFFFIINSFLASGDFWRLSITFEKQFGPRSGPTEDGPDLSIITNEFLKDCFEKVYFDESQ